MPVDEKAFEAANTAYLTGHEVRHRDRLLAAITAYEAAKAAPAEGRKEWKAGDRVMLPVSVGFASAAASFALAHPAPAAPAEMGGDYV